jgi:hypothetical protein
MNRVTLFAKGNVDVHDSLHSCRIGGEVLFNGINEVVRARYPGNTVRVRHETASRSDALLNANDDAPADLVGRSALLGAHKAETQFSAAIFNADADVIVLSIMPDVVTRLMRHRNLGYLFYPHEMETWSVDERAWLRDEFVEIDKLDATASMSNHMRIVERIRERSDAPILIYNVSTVIPGEMIHCFQGLDDSLSTSMRRFNLALIELSQATGVSIIDVDTLVAQAGADRLKLDAFHLSAEGYRLIAEEVVRVLDDLGLFRAEREA